MQKLGFMLTYKVEELYFFSLLFKVLANVIL